MSRLVLLLLLSAGLVPAADAPLPLRRLCLDAPLVVLAAPVDPITPTRFRVQAVLKGSVPTADTLAPTNLAADRVRSFDAPDFAERKPRPRHVARALLFLEPHGKGWKLLPGGLRFCTDDGRLLALNDKGSLDVQDKLRWAAVLTRARDDLATLDQLQAYRRVGRPARRVQALLGWIQEHKGEFSATGPGTDEAPAGWDWLQLTVFDWVFASAGHADAWRAVRLYAELNQGDNPRLPSALFGTSEGRAFLLDVARDDSRLPGERGRAVQILRDSLGEKELQPVLDALPKLLAVRADAMHVATAQLLVTLGAKVPPTLLTTLADTYRDSPPGPGRDELAVALCTLAPATQWKDASGNPPGVCACLRDCERRDGLLHFWLTLKTPGLSVFEAPVLVCERTTGLGTVADTKRLPLTVRNLDAGWAAGWAGDTALVVEADVSKLQSGATYRVRVEGFVGKGKDRQRWLSEPRLLQVPAKKPGATGPRMIGD